MKYILLSLRSMKGKLYIMLFVLSVSFFMLLLFYGETVRNHHFVLSTVHFKCQKAQGEELTTQQWKDVCRAFREYEDKIEGEAYVSVTLRPQGEDIYSSLYYFQGEKNTFTKEQYETCAKIIKTDKEAKELKIGSTLLSAQHWDSGYSEIPITTVAKEKFPIWDISIVCGCMSGNDYKNLGDRLQKILPSYSCSVDQVDQVIQMERQKTYLFLVAVLVSIFNIALIYQYIMQAQRYHIIIYRLCGGRRHQLYAISLVVILMLFVVSFTVAVAGYLLFYPGMYRLGIVSLKNAMGIFYIGLAGVLCGLVTILLLMICSAGLIRRPVKELYVEGA